MVIFLFTNPSSKEHVLNKEVRQHQALLVETGQSPPGQNVSGARCEVAEIGLGGEVFRDLVDLFVCVGVVHVGWRNTHYHQIHVDTSKDGRPVGFSVNEPINVCKAST